MSPRRLPFLPSGLQARLSLWVATLLLAFGFFALLLSLRSEERTLRQEMVEHTIDLSSMVAASATDPLLLLDVGSLRRLLAGIRQRQGLVTEALIFDEELRVLTDGTHENPRRHEYLGDELAEALARSGEPIVLEIDDAAQVVTPIRRGDELAGGLAITFSTESFDQSLAAARQRNALLGSIFVAVALLASIVLARRWMQPIRSLTIATERVAQGELDQALPVSSNDELGLLAAAFNTMTRRLRESTVSRDYMDRVLESMAESLLVLSPGGLVYNVNSAACVLLRARPEDLEGHAFTDLLADPVLREDPALADLLSGRRPLRNHETRLLGLGGEEIPVMLSITPLGRDEAEGSVCVATDLRDLVMARRSLQASERRARQLIERSPDAILIVVEEKIVFLNPAGGRMLGADAERLVGRPLAAFLDPKRPQQAHEALLPSDEPIFREQVWRRLNGEAIEVELAASELRHGERPAVQLVLRNITERKKAERLKDEIMSVVGHELRTPLTALRGAIGLLRSGAASDRTPTLLDMAHRHCERLTFLVNNILDLQKLESGDLELAKERIDLATLIWDSIEEHKPLAARREIDLVASEGSGAFVEADRHRLLQVMGNLLTNAVKHSPNGGKVEISASMMRDVARIAVTNRGETIPSAKRDKIFEKFALADNSNTRRHNGTGLGLSISKEIIELHGGTIDFTSAEETGTTFFVDLPVAAAPS